MKSITFQAKTDAHSLNGTLLIREKNISIFFDTTEKEFRDHSVNERNIKDYGNFIASFIRRLDTKEKFSSVTVNLSGGAQEFEIIRENLKTETVNVVLLGEIEDQNVYLDQTISLITFSQTSKTKVKLFDIIDGAKKIAVPLNLIYCRDQILNEVLAFNLFKHDYDRTINKSILEKVKELKRYLIDVKDSKESSVHELSFAYVTKNNKINFVKPEKFLYVLPLDMFRPK